MSDASSGGVRGVPERRPEIDLTPDLLRRAAGPYALVQPGKGVAAVGVAVARSRKMEQLIGALVVPADVDQRMRVDRCPRFVLHHVGFEEHASSSKIEPELAEPEAFGVGVHPDAVQG